MRGLRLLSVGLLLFASLGTRADGDTKPAPAKKAAAKKQPAGKATASPPTAKKAPAVLQFSSEGARLAMPANLLRVPLVQQRTDFSCGDVSTLAVLRYYDYDHWSTVPEARLYSPLGTTHRAGTDPNPMAAYLNGQGVHAVLRTGASVTLADITRSIDAHNPVIVAIQAWQAHAHVAQFVPWATDWADGHWVVAVGYNAGNIYFMDPSTGGAYTYIPRQQFLSRWHDVVGAANTRTQHISIFVTGTPRPHTSERPMMTPQRTCSRIN